MTYRTERNLTVKTIIQWQSSARITPASIVFPQKLHFQHLLTLILLKSSLLVCGSDTAKQKKGKRIPCTFLYVH